MRSEEEKRVQRRARYLSEKSKIAKKPCERCRNEISPSSKITRYCGHCSSIIANVARSEGMFVSSGPNEFVNSIEANLSVQIISIGCGMYLRVSPRGKKLWFFEKRHNGRRITRSIGSYPNMAYDAAHEECRKMMGIVMGGDAPPRKISTVLIEKQKEGIRRNRIQRLTMEVSNANG